MRNHPPTEDPPPNGDLRAQLTAALAELQEINDSTMSSGQPTNGMCVQRWIGRVSALLDASLPQRMRDAAATIDEVTSLAGPWGEAPVLSAAASDLREHADSLQELLSKVLAK